ncbi:DUF3048 domain-containing protein [Paramaledivibacter caminithermalis]|jgi:hypothetical protein|uniref:Lipoprotein YerB n=1 Tax=Paramaledivibacter caminithermalis (strain DSM 15212 / CIP 107654 / DViRD3) TaxID=1121301 RepID=A0A1M6M7H9_PARC5|nr:DUF3048 domain-containing protein [Paramaledivibacter caminithermalis]SHJ79416.1 Protein of unknown function [Paramaledivibacter caminithermalis DSM 15212]
MKKILIAVIMLTLLIGCTNTKVASKDSPENKPATNEKEVEIKEETKEIVINDNDDNDKEQKEKNIDLENKIKSPLTGLYIDKEKLNDRPIVVMLDNYYKARPQAGLSKADVVYEVLAEGNITRYMAVIYTSKPKSIGPIRSSRPYFIDKALEYDPLYVHVGGSEQAKKDIKNFKMADIDGLSSGGDIFWRKNHKPIPNNMYSSYEAIMKQAKRRKYNKTGNFETLQFNEEDMDIDGEELTEIKIPYRGKKYTSGFKYNKEDGLYYRYVNNKPHLDEISKSHIIAKNILVQYVADRVIDNVGRLEMNLVGEGKGLYITNGKMMDVKWKKTSRRALTRFYDLKGNEIKLNPGITWYQIVPDDLNIITK